MAVLIAAFVFIPSAAAATMPTGGGPVSPHRSPMVCEGGHGLPLLCSRHAVRLRRPAPVPGQIL
jgi:hypothetical protein